MPIVRLPSKHDGFEFHALHAPAEGSRRGGVIVVQEIFGIDRYVEEDVARWSALGFETLAPSMFDRQQPGFVAHHDLPGLQTGSQHAAANGRDNAMGDIQACIDHLKPRGPVFIVGYCYGGTMAWLAASLAEGLSAASSYYGGVAALSDMTLKCPVIVHFGRLDAHLPAEMAKDAVKADHPEAPVYIYEASGHGFNNDGRPDSDPDDAALARWRTLELFEANGAL